MTVAKTSSPAAEADNGGQSFGLSEVLIAFREQDQLPADIRELVNFSLTNPGQYQRWFPAETVEQIGPAVHRLAEITREFAGALLRGDLDCFDLLSKQRTNLTELRQRKMWLNELPASLAAQCELIPTSELKRIRDEYLKEQILAKRGDEFDDIQGLPAEEFLKAYASRAVQRSK